MPLFLATIAQHPSSGGATGNRMLGILFKDAAEKSRAQGSRRILGLQERSLTQETSIAKALQKAFAPRRATGTEEIANTFGQKKLSHKIASLFCFVYSA